MWNYVAAVRCTRDDENNDNYNDTTIHDDGCDMQKKRGEKIKILIVMKRRD